MSIVLGYANSKNAIIMSDGRAGGTVNPSETYDKTRKINDNIILGFVGYRETSEHFLNCVYADMGERIENCYIDEFLEEVEYGMSLDVTREKLKSTLMIIGKKENGDIRFTIAGQDTNFKLKDVSINSIYFIGGTIPIEDIREICVKNSKSTAFPYRILKKTIEDVSDKDESINKNIFFKAI